MITAPSNIIVVIPARGGSRRLKHKNIYPVNGMPMICHAIRACIESKWVLQVIVSTDSRQIVKTIKNDHPLADITIVERDNHLCQNRVAKHTVIKDAMAYIAHVRNYKKLPDAVISLQANSPEITGKHIDEAIKKLESYKLDEVMSVDKDGIGNGALRVMRWKYAWDHERVSTNFGTYQCDLIDVHYLEDVKKVEARWKS